MGVSLNAIGQVEALTNPAAARLTYQQALALRRETGDQRGEMATELNLGSLYQRTNDLGGAIAAYNRALALGARIDAPLLQSNALKALSEAEAARGNYRAAYQHQLQQQELRDRMFNVENSARFQRLQIANEAERRERRSSCSRPRASCAMPSSPRCARRARRWPSFWCW